MQSLADLAQFDSGPTGNLSATQSLTGAQQNAI